MTIYTKGTKRHQVRLEVKHIGDDILLLLSGGTPHLGGCIICRPDEETKILRFERHHDHEVLFPLAEHACKKYKTTVIATGGIHVDSATPEDIKIIIDNCKDLESCI